jgi:hypothetical protein
VKLTAFTSSIHATASIAELFTAPTAHMVAAFRLLDPIVAEGALLIFGTSHEFFESLIVLVWVSTDLEFFTSLPDMVRSFASQAVTLFANITGEIITIYLWVENKPIVAIGTWAPRNILLKTQ